MSTDFPKRNHPERLLRYLDGELPEDERLAVEAWLKENQSARALLSQIAEQAITVADLERAQRAAQPASATNLIALPRTRVPSWLGIAAILVAGLALGALWLNPNPETPIARLEFVSKDAVFSANHQLPRTEGSVLDKGWVRLEQGDLRIVFGSGASVELTGPAEFGIDSAMRSYLDYGHVRVYAPESARNFVVATESMEVVDLGTRFELAVNEETRESDVTVSEGLVDLHLGSPGAARRIQPLEAGFTAKLNEAGDILAMRQLQVESKTAPRLVAHWKLDEVPSGDLVSISGVAGRAVELGRNGFVDVSDWAEELGQTEAFTISAWVRNPSPGVAILFSLSDGTETDRVQLHLNRGHLVFGWQTGLHYDAVHAKVGQWEADPWYHVAAVWRKGVISLFRDGEQIGSSSFGHKIGTRVPNLASVKRPAQAYFGKLSDSASGGAVVPQYFGGAIDDVQIYAKALQHKNVRYLYEHPGKIWDPRLDSEE